MTLYSKKQIAAVLLVAGLIIGLGCDRYIESSDPVRSMPDKPATPTELVAVINSQAVSLSWTVSSSDGIDRYRVYRSTDESGPFVVTDSSTADSITISGLAGGSTFYFKVASVTAGGMEGSRSTILAVRFGVIGISINSNQTYTSNRSIQVQLLTGISVTQVALSEDVSMADSVLLPYSGQVAFELSYGDGLKTVFARYTFVDGSRSGDLVSDDIILDTRARIDSVSFTPTSTVFYPGDTIRFFVDVAEVDGQASVSFGQVSRMKLYNDGQDADVVAGDSIFSGWYVVPENVSLTDGTVTGTFRDEAGNSEVSLVSSDRVSIRSTMLPVELVLVEPKSSFEMDLQWTEAAIVNFQSYRIYRGVGTAATDDSTLVGAIANRSQTTLTDDALDESTEYSYTIYLRDQLGRDTLSNTLSATTEANQIPQGVILAGTFNADSATAMLSWSTSQDADFESYRVFRSATSIVTESDQMVVYLSVLSATSFRDFIPVIMDTAWYRVYVYDRHDASTGSNTVTIVK